MSSAFVLVLALAASAPACDESGGLNPNSGPNRDTHTMYFPITSATAHGTVDCNTCHGAFDTFTQFDCLSSGCHPQAETDGNHVGNADYSYDSNACYRCHPDGKGFDHNQVFPLVRNHAVPCATCHIDPSTKKVFSCTVSPCHTQGDTDPRHDGVSGYLYSPTSCYGCHFQGRIPGGP